jgi:hypothetical protein
VAVALGLGAPVSAQAAEFQVDRTDDLNFVFPGANDCIASVPNDCTLRGALYRADQTTQADLVSLPPGTFRRDATQPSIEILHSVAIAGAGARSTIIEGAGVDGPGPTLMFTIQAGQVTPNTSQLRDVTITKGTNVRGGGAAASGAGIMSDGTNLSLDRVTVSGNEARGAMSAGSGGGIGFLTAGRTLTIDNSAITGNKATGGVVGTRGAGIIVTAGSATIRNSTIAGNVADGNGAGPAQGGGIAVDTGGAVTLDRVTVAGNVAQNVGANQAVGNLWRDVAAGATITAKRSIVADGIAPAGSNTENCVVPITSQEMNVEDRNQCGFGAADRRSTPVGLGVLANYGGPTDTRSITGASPAFDFAGDCLMADQRALAPAFAACDSGAFELQAGDPVDGSPPPGGGGDELPAELSGYGLSRTTFAAAGSGASVGTKAAVRVKAKVGTTVSYTVSEPATVTFTVEQVKGGRQVAGVCRKPTRKNRTQPRCDLPLKGSFTDAGEVGANAFKFTGRLNGKALKPGKYQLVATALDGAGNSTLPQRTTFTIVER